MNPAVVDVVVPTVGRPSLRALLVALAAQTASLPRRIILVDDRREATSPLLAGVCVPRPLAARIGVLPGAQRGPAAARNVGWRASDATWIAFLDDDVVPLPGWAAALAADLADAAPDVAGSQGRLRVPRPRDRRPTDWERNTIGLESAHWATADMAYRREALLAVGGFDERFPRAYREDADLALRILGRGGTLVRGRRETWHPVRPADAWVSLRAQAGNADDVLMRALHGPGWRHAAGAPPGRLRPHVATTLAALAAGVLGAAGAPAAAALAATAWAAATAEFAWRRIAPGPRTAREVATMLATSALIPPLATWHHVRGRVGLRRRLRGPGLPPLVASTPLSGPRAVDVVLFDRDGTLIADVPYNADPARVVPMPGAREALDRLRAAGVRVAVVTNQSGVARGLLRLADVARVNARVEALLGPFDAWEVCPHADDAGCRCRKPAPGMIVRVLARFGVAPQRAALVGDIGADVDAARAAGVRAVLVPTPVTRAAEIDAAPEVARDLCDAVERVLQPPAASPAAAAFGGSAA